ncbi:MAG: PAS domain S-box protein [Leptospiraceae bacterium]|nr:PAS domain S-box protein [Leptospiraceae bacterium]
MKNRELIQSHSMSWNLKNWILFTFLFISYFASFPIANLLPDRQHLIVPVWISSGISLAIFLVRPRKEWGILSIGLLITGLASYFFLEYPFWESLRFSFGEIFSSISVAWIMNHEFGERAKLQTTKEIFVFLIAVIALNFLSSLIGSRASLFYSISDFFIFLKHWWISITAGMIVVTPLILSFSKYDSPDKYFTPLKLLEFGIFLLVWCLVSLNMLTPTKDNGPHMISLRPYMLPVLLIWPALRFGLKGITLACVMMIAIVITGPTVINGPSIWGGSTLADRFLEVQIFASIISAIGFFLTASYSETRTSEFRYKQLVEQTVDGIFVADKNGNFLDVNSAGTEMLGYSRDEILNLNIADVLRNEMKPVSVTENLKKYQDGKIVISEWIFLRKNGSEFSGEIVGRQLPDGRVQAILRDITTRKANEDQLNFQAKLLSRVHDAIVATDENLRIMYWNEVAEKLFGWNQNEAIGLLTKDILKTKSSEHEKDIAWKHLLENGYYESEVTYECKDGKIITTDARAAILQGSNGEFKGVVTSIRDITERKTAEKIIQENRERLQALFEIFPVGIIVLDKNSEIVEQNPIISKILGLTPEELRNGSKYKNRKYFKEDGSVFSANELPSSIAKREGKIVSNVEIGFEKEKGDFVWTSVCAAPLPYDDFNIVIVATDITELKRHEESLKKLSRAVEQSGSTIVITDIHGNIEYVNSKFTQTTGYAFNDVLGKNPRILKSGEFSPEDYKILWETILSGKEWKGELHNRKKNGELYWELASISPIINDQNEITSFLAVKEDITDRKIAGQILQESIREKELLLSEIHHRVKNNLQVVSAIINMGASVIKDKDVVKFLNDTSLRVRAMGILHNKLYTSSDFAHIDMLDYIQTIVEQIAKIQNAAKNIRVIYDIRNIEMNIETAMPCGLIVNEVVTNSFKYAFLDRQAGEIGISLHFDDESYSMRIYDDGVGIRKKVNPENSPTLGLQMIHMLTKQLHGTISTDDVGGVSYTFTFKPILKDNKRWAKKT